ncbi:unnamed protein product, partial [Adineta steineri]
VVGVVVVVVDDDNNLHPNKILFKK